MTVDALVARAYLERPLDGLASSPATLVSPKAPWLKALRSEAVERVDGLKIPTSRDEDWRFTDISALAKQSFHPVRTPTALQASDIAHFHIEEATIRLVFVDGVHARQLSRTGVDGDGGRRGHCIVDTLSEAVATQSAIVQPHLGHHAEFDDDLFTALNTAFLHDAAVVVVPRGTVVAEPVHLLFIATQPDVASHPRILLVAEAGSAVTLIEDHVAMHQGTYFTNSVAEVVLGPNAKVEHVRVQRESRAAFHIGSCAVSLGHASRYHSVSVAFGARISRLALAVVQTAESSECSLDGLALIGERQLADTHSFIDHAKPNGTSRQVHKTIVDGAAHAVFNGRVRVRPRAQQTDSAQSSHNLLLSTKAQVDTLPQLEIFADDVKCTHGATVGQLDSEKVFYLRSRGLSEVTARNLLTYAFGAEVIERISVASLRRRLEQMVFERTTTNAAVAGT